MPFYVYILYSQSADRYYVGESENVNERLSSHLKGISKYTSVANDWKIVHVETFESRLLAIKREREIKKKKSRKYIEWLLSNSIR